MILCNALATSIDNPYLSNRSRRRLEVVNFAFGWLFFVEAALKIFAFGLQEYARSALNLFDGLMGFLFLLEFSLRVGGVNPGSVFAAMRTFRMLRVFKLARQIGVFRVLLSKIIRAAATVLPMMVVLMVFLFIFAVLFMQLLTGMYDTIFDGMCDDAKPWKLDPSSDAWHTGDAYDAWWRLFDRHCASKPRSHFDEFQYAFLTIFQVMTCDNWPWIMWDTYNARGGLSFALFPLVIILGHFVALNLFLAILLAEFGDGDMIHGVKDDLEDGSLNQASHHLDERGLKDHKDAHQQAGDEAMEQALEDMEDTVEMKEHRVLHMLLQILPTPLRKAVNMILARQKARREARAAAAAEEKRHMESQAKRLCRSLMRQRQSKYGLLNAWEVANFKMKFKIADLDGDGMLTLEEVHMLVAELREEPEQLATWELLDGYATRSELITMHELLVFLSIKRNDEVECAKADAPQHAALRQAHQQRITRLHRKRRTSLLPFGLGLQLAALQQHLRRATLESLPPLGEFARDALGRELSRSLQRFIFSYGWWYASVCIVTLSSGLLTVEIDDMVREMRLNGVGVGAGVEGNMTNPETATLNRSHSAPSRFPMWVVIAADTCFMLFIVTESLIKGATQGVAFLRDGWVRLDLAVLFFSLTRALFPSWNRTLSSACALRIFLLVSRVPEINKLFTSILRSLPNLVVTAGCCAIMWLIFTALGVTFFGGRSHQCAALHQAAGFAGCGVAEGASMYTVTSHCRYAMAPLPVPYGVVPGVTNASACGCAYVDGVPDLGSCRPHMLHGVEVAWVRAFPNFDSAPMAMLALFQVATLDGWANLYHFAMDSGAAPHVQPMREAVFLGPLLYYLTFVIFGVFFLCNIFVGVVIDEFRKIKQEYDSGSACLTKQQQYWVSTQRLIFRLRPEKVQVREPDGITAPRRRSCFRLVYDAEKHGLPSNAPEGATYRGHRFEQCMSVCIALNIALLCLWTNPTIPILNEGPGGVSLYSALNLVFVAVFTLEVALKLAAYSCREFLKETSNRFDFFLVVVSIAGLLIAGLSDDPNQPEMRALRCLCALRIFRLSQASPSLLKMMRTVAIATPSIGNMMLVLCVFIFFYSQVGMALLGTLVYDPYGGGFNRHANFETFTRAFHSLWRMATGDDWSLQFADAYWNPHVPGVNAPPVAAVTMYFLMYMMFMGWWLVSIFVAIILDYFQEAGHVDGLNVAFEDIEDFQRKWLEFDVFNTGYINTIDLGLLLYSCEPPLVAVRKRSRRDSIFNGNLFGVVGEWVRPRLSQLPSVLCELDVPDHDGKLHFLEVILALLQRVTGVVSEEDLMAQLLRQHPKYLPSLKRLARISGSTSDPTISAEIVSHLKRGLDATGLAEEAEQELFSRGHKNAAAPTGLRGLLKRMLAVKPVEATSAGSGRRAPPTNRAAGFNTPVPSDQGIGKWPSPLKKRKASLASWAKGTQVEKEDDLEC